MFAVVVEVAPGVENAAAAGTTFDAAAAATAAGNAVVAVNVVVAAAAGCSMVGLLRLRIKLMRRLLEKVWLRNFGNIKRRPGIKTIVEGIFDHKRKCIPPTQLPQREEKKTTLRKKRGETSGKI